ncbi:uncharacterized protein LOC121426853 [Lytechinus variegatus]|uniref:uncharacterized protein LOC121426853 n=1 Tax=Lytechinus variegatus TaxID=7654 RepID=UPI001BB0E979|nr:uncharacterized protein LOC121426853 [Lytechinus variegatus]XP_041479188.1 uncharacterized protein LOC121426853 [Lytechinus variegatus]XP_041479189.1 uncharacterized protein LOC121426853 [Lytechinus variegatus]
MFNSILEKLLPPTQSQCQQTSCSTASDLSRQDGSDQEEDGFLVVGETMSERNTVLPAHYSANRQQGQPPTYSQVQQSATSYPIQTSSSGTWSSFVRSSVPSTSSNPAGRSDVVSERDHSPTYATLITKDIPFQLSEQLRCAHKLSTDMSYFAVPPLPTFNPTKYFYDFDEERRILRETADSYD